MTQIGDRIYLGVYTLARIWSMRPDGSDLAELDRIEDEQTRPTDAWYDRGTRQLLIATEADYGKINGSLAGYRPSDGGLTVRRGIVPNQSLKSVTVHNGIAYLGSETRNSLGTEPIEKEATVSRVDRRTGRVLDQFAPVPGAQQITDLMPYQGRVYGTTEKGDLFVLDRTGRQVAATVKIGTGASSLVLAGDDGLYGTDGKRLFEVTPGPTPTITTVVDGLAAQAYAVGLIAASPDGRTLYTIKGRNLIAVTDF